MDGVYLTFYKNHVSYHTKFDTLTYVEGGRRSLQAMIEAIRHSGLEMLSAPITSREDWKDPVFFDGLSSFTSLHCSTSDWIAVLWRHDHIWEMNSVHGQHCVPCCFPVLLVFCWVIYLFITDGNHTSWCKSAY